MPAPLFFVDGTTQPVLDTSVRAGFTAVTMAGPGLIKLDAGNVKWVSGGKNVVGAPLVVSASAFINATPDANGTSDAAGLMIVAGADTTLLADSPDRIRFFSTDGASHPTLIVRAGQSAIVGKDGRLFIDPAPVADDAVINQDTGEQLDVSSATRLGSEQSNDGITLCGAAIANDDGGRCAVEWLGGVALLAPVGGILTCLPTAHWQLTAGAFVLDFAGSDQTLPPSTTGQLVRCLQPTSGSHAVDVGYQIADHGTAFRITATTVDGTTPLSVAIGDDGAIYVGHIPVTVGCPCLAGP